MQFRDPVGAHRNAGVPVSGSIWREQQIRGEDVAGVVFHDCTFERVHFEGVVLEQTMFLNSRFDDCTFDDCRIVDTRWIECQGTGFSIAGGEFSGALISQCRLSRIDLRQAGQRLILSESKVERLGLSGAGSVQHTLTMSGCTFGAVEAENASWKSASAVEIDFKVWSLTNARFERCSFIRATGDGVDFSTVEFDSCNLYQSVFRKARFRHAERSIFAECDLTEADLVDGRLAGALFAKSCAPGARFERAFLDGALFANATLSGALFTGATAKQSVWTEADLTEANLEGVDAFRATFRNAVLDGARAANARLVEADLHGVEAPLEGAELRGSRGTVLWRAERESEIKSEGS